VAGIISASVTVDLDPQLVLKATNKAIEKALTSSAIIVKADAQINAPVDLGQLRSSIAYDVDGKNRVASVFTPLEYGIYIEYGTGLKAEGQKGRKTPWVYKSRNGSFVTTTGQSPKPFMRSALFGNRDLILKTWIRVFNEVL
jgi:HK97 gp10 family phage protein